MLLLSYSLSAAFDSTPLKDLAGRVVPGFQKKFKFEKISSADGKDVFEIESVGDQIVIRGNNANSMARGLGDYLRKYCYVTVSWDSDNPIELPEKLPVLKKKERVTCCVKNRFFFNYCTFGYTMPFWTWERWERCIDWMALNGINAPLAISGTEKILLDVWTKHGFTKDQVLSFFTDAAHLPWYHMNTISRWGGPCPDSYVEYGYNIQKKIVKRERGLGMRPILMAFNGRVPVELKKKYPKKEIHVLGKGWGMFTEKYYTYFLDPYDPLFAELQKDYLEAAEKLYGTDHLYGVDPFNEIEPPSWEPEYLANTAKRVYKTMSDVDKDAVWIQMGWLFSFDKKHWTSERIKALLKAVPDNKLVILDYFCESKEIWKETEAFFNTPFIWCYLGNFGGKECLAGPLPNMYNRIAEVKKERGGKNLWGIGSSLEGFGVNMMTYEFLFDNAWSNMSPDLETWIVQYARSRSAGEDKAIADAWKLLLKRVYNNGSNGYLGGSPLHVRPMFEGTVGFVNLGRNFNTKDLMDIWSLQMKASKDTIAKDSFRYDLVNVIRQYLGDISMHVRTLMRRAYFTNNKSEFDKTSAMFMDLFKDQAEILKSRPEFLLGRWTSDAYKIAKNDKEKAAFDSSIRNLLTTWGGRGCPLLEYANRDWIGLTDTYYAERWRRFIKSVSGSMSQGVPFYAGAFNNKIMDFEWDYAQHNRVGSIDKPEGDSWEIAKRLYAKYSKLKLSDVPLTVHKAEIASWQGKEMSKEYKIMEWDVSKFMSRSGVFVIKFGYNKWGDAIMVRNVKLKCSGDVVGQDLHEGAAINADKDNIFKFKVNEIIPAAKYTLEAEMMAYHPDRVKKVSGKITLEIFDPK
jgi:alpha-N-acetylglucosaminidase